MTDNLEQIADLCLHCGGSHTASECPNIERLSLEQQIAEALETVPCNHRDNRDVPACPKCQTKRIAGALKAAVLEGIGNPATRAEAAAAFVAYLMGEEI